MGGAAGEEGLHSYIELTLFSYEPPDVYVEFCMETIDVICCFYVSKPFFYVSKKGMYASVIAHSPNDLP